MACGQSRETRDEQCALASELSVVPALQKEQSSWLAFDKGEK